MIHDYALPPLTPARAAIHRAYLQDESEHLDTLFPLVKLRSCLETLNDR
jgi:hypothetical protein